MRELNILGRVKRQLNKLAAPLLKANEINRRKHLVKGKTKYFCIGINKTGTTSLEKAFVQLDYLVGNQFVAERLFDKYYAKNNFKPIIKYCETAQVFQDIPFSCPETYKYLDRAYPGSKFILTVRDNAEQWYSSITRFHAKKFGLNGRIPTAENLKNATYLRLGYTYDAIKILYQTPDGDLYNKQMLIDYYNRHNEAVLEYFKRRPEDLLVINLAESDAYARFVEFIGVETEFKEFPWENKT